MASDPRGFFERFVTAMNAHDLEAVVAMVHPKFVGESLQSGERSKGREGFAAQLTSYPGIDESPISMDEARLMGDDERYAITPGFTVVPLSAPNKFTACFRSRYPDGKWWRIILLVELRDDMLYRMENYFAPELPAPLAESIAAYQHG